MPDQQIHATDHQTDDATQASGLTRRRLLTASGVSALTAGLTVFAAEEVRAAQSRRKRPTDRVSPRPETTATAVAAQVVWRAEPAQRLVSLTFDDGPDPRWTPRVLEVLARHSAHATFFQLGDAVQAFPGIAREVVDAGHEVANHGWGHRDLTDLTTPQLRDNLVRTHDVITSATGLEPTLVRPPWGRIDAPGLFVAAELGYRVALWSHHLPTDGAERKVDHNLGCAGAGMIMLCHDGRSTPAESLYVAVDRLVASLTEDGYRFVTTSALLDAPTTT